MKHDMIFYLQKCRALQNTEQGALEQMQAK